MRSSLVLALVLGWGGAVFAQAPSDRPSEQDIFGAPAATPAPPAAATPPAAGAPPAAAPTPPAAGTAAPGTAPTPTVPGDPSERSTVPPAAAAEGTARDQSVLGNSDGAAPPLSDYIAPENPLQIGGQIYLRAQTTALQGQVPARWALNAPALVDAYFDARPNPRVRAFILGRMNYNPTASPAGSPVQGLGTSGGQGAFVGGSATGFTTFSTARGPNSILDQMWLRFDILEHVFMTVGKQHVRWGTGRFWQPTDYLHQLKRNPLDVFDARPGTSMVKLHVPWEDKGWNFYGFGVIEDVNAATNTLRQVAGGARAEIILFDAEIGLDALVKRGQSPRFGIDVSTGIGDFDVYADVGIRSGKDFNVVSKVDDPNAGVMCTIPSGETVTVDNLSAQYQVGTLSGVKTQAVVGANYARKYNDNDLWTLGAEYFYNQPGYANTDVYPGLLFNSSGQPQLNFFYTGRHYAALYASLPQPYSWNKTTFTLSTIGNLSDFSFVSRLDYSFTLLTHLSFEAFAAVHYGTRSGEFRLGFDIPTQYTLNPDGLTCTVVPGFQQQPVFMDLGVALRMKL